MSNTIERYESVIFPVPKTITSSWYPPSIIKTHKITKWGKKITTWGSFFRLQSGAAQKLQSGAKKSQSGVGITKWGKKNLKEAQVLQSGASFPQPSLWSSAHVWWNFFTKIVNCLQPLTVFAKTLLHRYLAGSKIRFWSLFNHETLISSSPENIRKNLVNETFLQVTNTNKNNR